MSVFAPSVCVLTCADQTRERSAVQRRIVVPEDREREERTVRHDQMRSRRRRLGLLLLTPETSRGRRGVEEESIYRERKGWVGKKSRVNYDGLGTEARERATQKGGSERRRYHTCVVSPAPVPALALLPPPTIGPGRKPPSTITQTQATTSTRTSTATRTSRK